MQLNCNRHLAPQLGDDIVGLEICLASGHGKLHPSRQVFIANRFFEIFQFKNICTLEIIIKKRLLYSRAACYSKLLKFYFLLRYAARARAKTPKTAAQTAGSGTCEILIMNWLFRII